MRGPMKFSAMMSKKAKPDEPEAGEETPTMEMKEPEPAAKGRAKRPMGNRGAFLGAAKQRRGFRGAAYA